MTSRATDSCGHASSTAILREENNHLKSDLKTFKQLFYLFSERHAECVKYIKTLKTVNQRLLKRLPHEDNTLNRLEEINCENQLLKFDKQIDTVQQQLIMNKSVHTQTSGQLLDKAIHRCITGKLPADGTSNSHQHHSAPPPPPNGKYRCEYFGCNQWFARKDLMDSHLRLHTSMQEAIAYDQNDQQNAGQRINEIIFVPQMELEVIEYNNNNNNGTHNESLSYTNSTSNDSNSHNRNGNNSANKAQIACDICGKNFSKQYIQSHRRSHTGVKPYKCSYTGCERTFTQSSSRNYHEKTYHRIDKYPLKCYYSNCEKSFSRQIDLQKHLTHHNGGSGNSGGGMLPFSASSLIAPTVSDQQLKRHTTRRLRRVPHRSGKHGCPHCGKTFAHKVALRQHEVIHGSKQFVCHFPECQYASYWKQNLSLHLRRHHNQLHD
ncbi:zinc finger protein 235-like [Oppia nitens]|uniref:zinc finger protein 235-like n=1 Tax=Oppia nitens TaxID=1686743 RepID=UPI0023DAAD4F|nr:zinc finger protein 235-like [Oppia nitens]XP_054166667.1 zinc finger protein 235-like [Oppia nitens]